MKTYILLGLTSINYFYNENWNELDKSIQFNIGNIIAWDKESDSVSCLLDMLKGWNEFIELSLEDLKLIEQNTSIEIDYKN